MKRIKTICTYIEEGTKKEKKEEITVYANDAEESTVKEKLNEVYLMYNNSQRHYENKNFLQSFEILKVVDF